MLTAAIWNSALAARSGAGFSAESQYIYRLYAPAASDFDPTIAIALLRGRGWQSAPKKEQSHFDKVDVESRVLETYHPITDKDIPDADIIMATSWETAEWVAKLSPSTGTKVYFLQHYEAFDYLPWEGDKES